MKHIKQYESKIFTEQINKGDLIKLEGDYFHKKDKKTIYKVTRKFYSKGSTDADDGKENLFDLKNIIKNHDRKTVHKDYIRKATKEEIEQLELEQAANKYNL